MATCGYWCGVVFVVVVVAFVTHFPATEGQESFDAIVRPFLPAFLETFNSENENQNRNAGFSPTARNPDRRRSQNARNNNFENEDQNRVTGFSPRARNPDHRRSQNSHDEGLAIYSNNAGGKHVRPLHSRGNRNARNRHARHRHNADVTHGPYRPLSFPREERNTSSSVQESDPSLSYQSGPYEEVPSPASRDEVDSRPNQPPSIIDHFDEIVNTRSQHPIHIDVSRLGQARSHFSRQRSRSSHGARPFYVIGHMANSVPEAQEFLKRGANALEADVSFANLSRLVTFHNIPCDCFRVCRRTEPLGAYLNFIRDVTDTQRGRFRQRLALLFLDLKLDDVEKDQKYQAGVNLGEMIIAHLWQGERTAINILVSIGRPEDRDVIRGVIDTHRRRGYEEKLVKRVGFDVGLNAPIRDISGMWKEMGVDSNLWQGDGITNCLSTFRGFNRVREALAMRNSHSGYVSKVYQWTLDFRFMIRYSMLHHVDGVITNYPDRALEVLSEFKPQVYRLATPEDDPWAKVSDPHEVAAKYPREGNLRRLLMAFTVRNNLGAGLELADSSLDLLKNLLAGISPRDTSSEQLSELYQYMDKVDDALTKEKKSILGNVWPK